MLCRPQESAAPDRDPARPRTYLDLLVTAILDEDGQYLGPMLTWEVVTEKHEAEARATAAAANTIAVNQVLMALGRAQTAEDMITHRWKSSARRSACRTARTGGLTRRRMCLSSWPNQVRSTRSSAAFREVRNSVRGGADRQGWHLP